MRTFTVTVVVRASARTRSITEEGGQLRVKTPVAAEKGRANKDVVDMLADHFSVPRSCVELLKGASSKIKTFKITA